MNLELHTISRDALYKATATYSDGTVTVHKGSFINLKYGSGFKPTAIVKALLEDRSVVSEDGTLLKDTKFESLSTAASFVAGRTSNGMITWKTEDGKYVRYSLKASEK